jgi:hypothetical protein
MTPIPTKDNPRTYTITTKVRFDVYKGLKQTATLEYGGNMSRLVSDILSESIDAEPVPDHIYEEALHEVKEKASSNETH